jgi:hypothetical protein
MAQLIGMLGAGGGTAMGAGTGAIGAGAMNAAAGAAPGAVGAAFTPSVLSGAAPAIGPSMGGGGGFLNALNTVQQFRQNPLGAMGGDNNPMQSNPFLQALQGRMPQGIQQVPANPLPAMGGKR